MDGGDGRRASGRSKKMSARVVEVIADDATRKRAASARLDSLERDNAGAGPGLDDDDEDFQLTDENGEPIAGSFDEKKALALGRRKTRHSKAAAAASKGGGGKTAQTFADILDAARLEDYPPSIPTYLTAAVGPPRAAAPRKFCSVCGCTAPYTCVRCGSRFCSIPCQTLHNDTRCLKFVT